MHIPRSLVSAPRRVARARAPAPSGAGALLVAALALGAAHAGSAAAQTTGAAAAPHGDVAGATSVAVPRLRLGAASHAVALDAALTVEVQGLLAGNRTVRGAVMERAAADERYRDAAAQGRVAAAVRGPLIEFAACVFGAGLVAGDTMAGPCPREPSTPVARACASTPTATGSCS